MGTTRVLCFYLHRDKSVLVWENTLKDLRERQQEMYTHVYV